MKVFVNDRPVDILPGMKVKHALIGANLFQEMKPSAKVYDAWGNEVGLEGALSDGAKIYVKIDN